MPGVVVPAAEETGGAAMPLVTFSIPTVAGKQRPRVLRSGRAYTPKETRDAEKTLAEAYREACEREYGAVLFAAAHVPVALEVTTERPLPKSRPRRTESEPDTYKPDWDNIGKLTDALNGVAWADDAQVTDARVEKRPRRRGTEPKTTITVSWGDERDAHPRDGEGTPT